MAFEGAKIGLLSLEWSDHGLWARVWFACCPWDRKWWLAHFARSPPRSCAHLRKTISLKEELPLRSFWLAFHRQRRRRRFSSQGQHCRAASCSPARKRSLCTHCCGLEIWIALGFAEASAQGQLMDSYATRRSTIGPRCILIRSNKLRPSHGASWS